MSATKVQTIFVLVTLAVCFSSTIAQLAGGVSEADVNDETIKEMAAFAVSELGSDYSLANITSAGKQVVSGMAYHIGIAVQKTSSGRPSEEPKSLNCKVKVHSQPWAGYLELTEHCCTLEIKPES